MGDHLEPVEAGQLHVEQHQVGRERANLLDRLGAGLGFSGDLDPGVAREKAPHLGARRSFVVDDQHADHGGLSPVAGKRRLTMKPPPSALRA
ncbi:MAG: hypothetical protein IPJ65_43460 [Archangiaceae bacterium]|nr:hypothetical protein [Archangiaceae bacterium]